jgi:hypothetical protein
MRRMLIGFRKLSFQMLDIANDRGILQVLSFTRISIAALCGFKKYAGGFEVWNSQHEC